MKQSRLLLFFLLTLMMSVMKAYAQTIGTDFTNGGVTYRITAKDLQTHNNTVAIVRITGTGKVTIPSTVQNANDKENYRVTSTIGWLGNQIQNGVTEVVFPEGLENIADGSFRQCDNPTFTKVTIPASCTYVGPQCFITNPSFTEFAVVGNNPTYKAQDGVLFTVDGTKLVNCPSGKSGNYSIPNTVTTVSPYAFSQCTKLDKITIPASVVHITEGSSFVTSASYYDVASDNPDFSQLDGGVLCNKAGTKIISYPHHRIEATHPYTIPASITEIGPSAFYVSNVSVLNLNNVEKIGDAAFQYSHSLETVTIGPKVVNIAEAAFSGCAKLAHIAVDHANLYYKAMDDVLFTKDGTHLVLCAALKSGDYTIPAGVKYIDGRSFTGTTRLGKVTVSKDVETIGTRVFVQSGVTAVTFEAGSKLNLISESAFYKAKKIQTIEIPASVTKIGNEAFRYMDALKTVTIQDGSLLSSLGDYVFSDNAELTTVTFPGSTVLTTIPEGTFSKDPKLTNFEIPSSVTTIAGRAFLDTPNLSTITFRNPAQIKTIGNGAFAYSGITSIVLPVGVEKIDQQAFDNCKNLKTIEIPASVTEVGTGAFNMCEGLTAFKVDAANTQYSSLDGMLCDKSKTTLVAFPAGKSDSKYTLVPYFTKVAAYAFYGSEKVTNITFPKTVTQIETRALALCKKLESLSFMGIESVPALTKDILYESSSPGNIIIYVRKAWFENPANENTIRGYNTIFKEIHPSFVPTVGYDRGMEFFPTSTTHVGAISFYEPRTSVIIQPTVKETAYTDKYGKIHPETSYTVSSILDFTFETADKVKAITVLANIGYIGMNAFKGTSIEALYFTGDIPGSLGSVTYEQPDKYSFKNGQNIYVKASKVNTYKVKWEVNGNTLNITSEIPARTLANRATACYPFNVVYNTGGDVMPYLPLQYKRMSELSQDNAYVRARSIDDGNVPAYIGVMLVSENSATATSYCRMNENQQQMSITGIAEYDASTYYMKGCVEDTQVRSDNDYTLFGLTKNGIFKAISTTGNTVPYFKSYLSIPKVSIPMGAKSVVFVFDDDKTTGISDDNVNENTSDVPYYDLKGMKVENPQRGIYIQNGKKIIIK